MFPKSEGKKTCSCIKVTAEWRKNNWGFSVKFEPIPIGQVAMEIKGILSAQYALVNDEMLDLDSNFLVRLTDLPANMTQIPTPHSLVTRETRASDRNSSEILKFSPRSDEMNWLLRLIHSHVDGITQNIASVKPKGTKTLCGIPFLVYDAVHEPLTRTQLRTCYSAFVKDTATQLQVMHVVEKIAHQDIRIFNVGYAVQRRDDASKPVVKAMYIDLDRGDSVDSDATTGDEPQYEIPRD